MLVNNRTRAHDGAMESTTNVTSPAGTLAPDAIVASSNTVDYSPTAIAKALTERLVGLQADLDRAVTDKAKAAKNVARIRAELVETQRTLRAMQPRKRRAKVPA